jgi:hypothetical protein
MEAEAMWRVVMLAVVLGLAHWAFVPMALEDLVARRRVIGGRKAPWVLAILFVTCLGSLLYLVAHPDLEKESAKLQGQDYRRS